MRYHGQAVRLRRMRKKTIGAFLIAFVVISAIGLFHWLTMPEETPAMVETAPPPPPVQPPSKPKGTPVQSYALTPVKAERSAPKSGECEAQAAAVSEADLTRYAGAGDMDLLSVTISDPAGLKTLVGSL